jgi:cyclopropane fatty-acyl-phospholipid synthase-like methyltransferase
LNPNQKGLDFGCGPGPTLSVLLEEQGQPVDLYDPFYYDDPSVFHKKYDFICATEVVEHLHDPNREFTALFKMLKPSGWLGLMTKLVTDEQAFRQWHYIRDMTHICFYSIGTFEYLAQRFDADLDVVANDVMLLKKKSMDSQMVDK